MVWDAPLNAVLYAAHLHEVRAQIDAALQAEEFDGVVIAAGRERPMFLDDQHYPFRANPWFRWLVPDDAAPGSLLVLLSGAAPRLLFVAPEDFWHSPPELPQGEWSALFTVEACPDAATALSRVQALPGRMAWIGEATPPADAWLSNPPRLLARLEQARCRKSRYELACLREATRIGVAGHLAAEACFREGGAEFDILLAFLRAVRQPESTLPYPPIVALNANAATLHYQHRQTLAPARPLSLLIDAGASCQGYGSDITRTWPRAPGLFASLVEGMHRVQQQLCAAVTPGADWRALHLQAHHLVAGLLREAEILRVDAEAAVATGVSAAFLPHGLGHLLGLQVHDVGGFAPAFDAEPIPRPPGHPALRLTRPLQPGMVVTVEPGLYFIDSLLTTLKAGPHAGAVTWPLVERLAAYGGIRIEDDVVVTDDGHDNLTRAAFAAVG